MWTLFSKSAYCEWKYNDTFESYSGGNIKYTFFQIHMTINAHFPKGRSNTILSIKIYQLCAYVL